MRTDNCVAASEDRALNRADLAGWRRGVLERIEAGDAAGEKERERRGRMRMFAFDVTQIDRTRVTASIWL